MDCFGSQFRPKLTTIVMVLAPYNNITTDIIYFLETYVKAQISVKIINYFEDISNSLSRLLYHY